MKYLSLILGIILIGTTVMASEEDFRGVALQKLSENEVIFPDCTLGNAYPMYNPAVDGVAYYEFEVLSNAGFPKGYIIVSTTGRDVPEYSHTTPTHFERFSAKLGHKNFKMFRYGLVYVVAEDKDGNLISEIGSRPPVLLTNLHTYKGPNSLVRESKSKETDLNSKDYPLKYHWSPNYSEFKSLYMLTTENVKYESKRQPQNEQTRATYTYYTVNGTKCYWGQIHTSTCYSGCGPTAWANVYGWWEKSRSKGNLFAGAPDPCTIESSVSDCIFSVVSKVGTYCIGDSGATNPWDIYKGYSYASDKGYGTGYTWHWRILGTGYSNEASILRQAASAGRPSIVGYYSDWHYAVGIQYKVNNADNNDIEVEVITGWGCNDTKWVHVSDTLAVVDFWIP